MYLRLIDSLWRREHATRNIIMYIIATCISNVLTASWIAVLETYEVY